MPIVPEERVEEAWQKISNTEPRAARRMVEKAARRQPGLLAYVMASVEDVGQDAQELATCMYMVILTAFESLPGFRIGKASEKSIDRAIDRNAELIGGLQTAHGRFQERVAEAQLEEQPYLLKYVVECLFEEDEEVSLTEQEQGMIFLTMRTVIDVLDQTCESASRGGSGARG